MHKFLIISAMVVVLGFTSSSCSQTKNAERKGDKATAVGFLRIAGNPEKFNDFKIAITGIPRFSDFENSLFYSSEDYKFNRLDSSILISFELEWIKENPDFKIVFGGKFTYIEGVFTVANIGQDAVGYIGYLRVSSIQVLNP